MSEGSEVQRRRAALVSMLFHRASEGILVFDANADLVDVSEAVVALVGEPGGSLAGRSANELFAPHPSEGQIGDHVRRLARGEASLRAWRSTVFVRTANGRSTPATLSLSAFEGTDDSGPQRMVLGLVAAVRDYEGYTRALIQADRLSTIGLLAGSAGHEIKNDLGPLIGYLSLLEAQGSQDPMVPLMRESVRRIHDHVEQVLEPLRPRSRSRGAIILRDKVDDVVVGMRRAGKLRRVDFGIVEPAPEPGVVVHADRDEVEQIVLNLLTNADDALGDESGGTRGAISVHLFADGDMGVCEVRDDGPGMEASIRARAFDPRFTTKPHRGTGLGLPVIRLIANDLGGRVRLETSPGEGTSVRVELPLYGR